MSLWHVRKYINQSSIPKNDVYASNIDSALSLARARFGHNVEVFGPHDDFGGCTCHQRIYKLTYLKDLNREIEYLCSASVG